MYKAPYCVEQCWGWILMLMAHEVGRDRYWWWMKECSFISPVSLILFLSWFLTLFSGTRTTQSQSRLQASYSNLQMRRWRPGETGSIHVTCPFLGESWMVNWSPVQQILLWNNINPVYFNYLFVCLRLQWSNFSLIQAFLEDFNAIGWLKSYRGVLCCLRMLYGCICINICIYILGWLIGCKGVVGWLRILMFTPR